MGKYEVLISSKAYRELDSIYEYIKMEFKEPMTALRIVELIEENILNLNNMPYRGAVRKVGIYANKGYRQIFVKNYTIIYRIDEDNKQVIIITIRYSARDF